MIDKDAVYIDVKTSTFDQDEDDEQERGLGEAMVVNLQSGKRLLGEGDAPMRLFSTGNVVNGTLEDETEDMGRSSQRKARVADREDDITDADLDDIASDDEDINEDMIDGEEDDNGYLVNGASNKAPAFARRRDSEANDALTDDLKFADSDSDLGSISGDELDLDDLENASDFDDADLDEESASRWKANLQENAQKMHGRNNPYRTADLARMMYNLTMTPAQVVSKWSGAEVEEEDEEEEGEDVFFKKMKAEDPSNAEDRYIPVLDYAALEAKWEDEENIEAISRRFAAGHSSGKDGEDDDDEDGGDFEGFNEDDEGDGEFEDLEVKFP